MEINFAFLCVFARGKNSCQFVDIKKETCQRVFIFKVTLTRLYLVTRCLGDLES